MNIGGACVPCMTLSTTLVLHLTVTWPWKNKNPIWYAQLILNSVALVSVRRLLSTDLTKTLVSSFVLSQIDYCNSLLYGCPQYLFNKLQKVQNNAARLVTRVGLPESDHKLSLLILLLSTRCPLNHEYSTNSKHIKDWKERLFIMT